MTDDKATADSERPHAVGAPVERPVRPDSEQWVRAWFAEHYQAGDVFAYCDAEAMTLQAAVKFAQAVAAAERERWRYAVLYELDDNGQARAIIAEATKA